MGRIRAVNVDDVARARPEYWSQEVRFLIVGTSVTSNAAGGKPAWSFGGGSPDAA